MAISTCSTKARRLNDGQLRSFQHYFKSNTSLHVIGVLGFESGKALLSLKIAQEWDWLDRRRVHSGPLHIRIAYPDEHQPIL